MDDLLDIATLEKAVVDFSLYREAGARNSKNDLGHIQAIHDATAVLGAMCAAKESAPGKVTDVKLIESAIAFPEGYRFEESAGLNPLVKIIDEGRGTSGWYPKDVLMRDGPEIFGPGTLMYANHATPAEEAARPEGDWNKLVAVTTGRAFWDENGKAGPALYAPSKVFSDFSQQVREKAPYTGASIRAGGKRDDKAMAPDGKPGVITSLTYAESIDLVTRAGRGGKLLVEAQRFLEEAKANPTKEAATDMDAAEFTKLLEANNKAQLASIQEANRPLIESNRKLAQRIAASESRNIIREALKDIRLPQTAKDRIESKVSEAAPVTDDGGLDTAKLKLAIEAALKEAGDDLAALTGGVVVIGQGSGSGELTEAQKAEHAKEQVKESNRLASQLGLKGEGARLFREGRNGFNPDYASSVAVAEVDND